MVADLSERIPAEERRTQRRVLRPAGQPGRAARREDRFRRSREPGRADFSKGLREVLEALEEQVVLMRLLGEAASPRS
jgi:heat-inducible transcriptional repressor